MSRLAESIWSWGPSLDLHARLGARSDGTGAHGSFGQDECRCNGNSDPENPRSGHRGKKNRTLAGPVEFVGTRADHHLPEGNNCHPPDCDLGGYTTGREAVTEASMLSSTVRATRALACQACDRGIRPIPVGPG